MKSKPKTKKVAIDRRAFDPLQIRVVEELAREIRRTAEEAGIPKGKVREITESLTFGIAAIIDGRRVMELDGVTTTPVLTFERLGSATLIGAAGGSWMHEYAIGIVEQMFERGAAKLPKSQVWMLRMEFPQGSSRAYSICTNIARPDGAIIAELQADCLRFKKSELSLADVSVAYLVSPGGTKRKIDVSKRFEGSLTAQNLLGIFRGAANKR